MIDGPLVTYGWVRRLDGQVRHVERVRCGVGVWRHHAPRPAPRDVGRLHVSRQLPLPFVAAVLEPDFHLNNVTVDSSASKSSIRRFVIMEKAPTRAFSWLKVDTTAFTFKTLIRHYAKWALTPGSLNVKLGPQRNYHKGQAAIRLC